MLRLAVDVESAGGRRGGEELERPLLLPGVVADRGLDVEVTADAVEALEEAAAIGEPAGTGGIDGEIGHREPHRVGKRAFEEERIVLHAEPSGKLPGAGVGGLARPVRERDRLRQRWMAGST